MKLEVQYSSGSIMMVSWSFQVKFFSFSFVSVVVSTSLSCTYIFSHQLSVQLKIELLVFPSFYLQCGKKKRSHSLQRFKTDTHFAAFSWWKCPYCHHMHFESSIQSCRANPKHSPLCYTCKGSDKQCSSEHGILSIFPSMSSVFQKVRNTFLLSFFEFFIRLFQKNSWLSNCKRKQPDQKQSYAHLNHLMRKI